MTTIKFNPSTNLIRLLVNLEYVDCFAFVMAFDPGASTVTITPEAAFLLGYTDEDLKFSKTTYTASGAEKVSPVIIKAINLEGERVENVEAVVMSLPKELKIDGLIGLNFLRHFKILLDVSEGLLQFERK